jgi:hypothetical protein
MKTKWIVIVFCTVILAACAPSAPATDAINTAIAQTQAAKPTETPSPTETLLPTETLAPTETALPTATPGPVVVKDDFSEQMDIWGDCDNCTLKDGALFFGPYEPKGSGSDQIFYIICESCGMHTYYRVSADVTFADGYGDRTFGMLAGLTEDKHLIGAGTVSTLKHALYEAFDYTTNQWVGGTFKKFNAVGAGRATNRILVEIKPASSPAKADIYLSVNGETVVTLHDQDAQPTWAGLYLGWHSVGAIYDNFEYEEIPVD